MNILQAQSGGGSQMVMMLLIMAVIYNFIIWGRQMRKQKKAKTDMEGLKKGENLVGNLESEIPANCPHCKNPNTKKIRLCEWCGNQIV